MTPVPIQPIRVVPGLIAAGFIVVVPPKAAVEIDHCRMTALPRHHQAGNGSISPQIGRVTQATNRAVDQREKAICFCNAEEMDGQLI